MALTSFQGELLRVLGAVVSFAVARLFARPVTDNVTLN